MIRAENPSDAPLVRAVHCAAFPTAAEADLVDALRDGDHLLVSLVALDQAQLVGHIAFSPVSIGDARAVGAGLAPVAVLPSHQRRGFGTRLIQAGLAACQTQGVDHVVVLGEPDYYRRFGFGPASQYGLENEYGVDDEFMVVELKHGSLSDVSGVVRYGAEFRAVS